MISMVVAMADNGAIGKDNRLLWEMPTDMQRFRDLTRAKALIMGKNTYESIGRPLPGRHMIVLAEKGYKAEGVTVVHSIEEALKAAQGDGEEIMIGGGANVYAQFLPRADRIYLTIVHGQFKADTYFPQWNKDEWQEVEKEEHAADAKNPYSYTFFTLERKKLLNR